MIIINHPLPGSYKVYYTKIVTIKIPWLTSKPFQRNRESMIINDYGTIKCLASYSLSGTTHNKDLLLESNLQQYLHVFLRLDPQQLSNINCLISNYMYIVTKNFLYKTCTSKSILNLSQCLITSTTNSFHIIMILRT